MLNSSVLDVGVGLILVYLILGLMCTTVLEWMAQLLKMRSGTLREGIRGLLSGPPDNGFQFMPEDLNAVKLLSRLTTPGDELAAALGLETSANPNFQAFSSSEIADAAKALAGKLNDAIRQPALWQRIDISRVSAGTLAAARKQPSGTRLLRSNYKLLREAYPEEIAGLAQAFYSHPLLKSLAQPGRHPSYIPARTFAAALVDILSSATPAGPNGSSAAPNPLDSIRWSIDAWPPSDVKRALSTLLHNADNDLALFRTNLETWFEDTMDRVSGWYKNKAQIVTAVVASGLTIFANADTVQIARKLYLNPAIREKIAQDAVAVSREKASDQGRKSPGLTPQEKADLGELTGWSTEFKVFHGMSATAGAKTLAEVDSAKNDDAFPGFDLLRNQVVFWPWLWAIVPTHLLGWLLTAIAVSLGAPFWFDTLNKFMNIRAAGTAPNEKGKDLSKA